MTAVYKQFTDFCNECQNAVSDLGAAVWPRSVIVMWAKEAFQAFPIYRPITLTYTMSFTQYMFHLPDDYQDVLSVEYPINEDPPHYMHRMSKYDDSFYDKDDNFDIERDYVLARGHWIWGSKKFVNGTDVKVNYLATNDVDLDDLPGNPISIAPMHEHICIAYVVMKCYIERLSTYMKNPTAYTGVIAQMVDATENARNNYNFLVQQAIQQQSPMRPVPRFQSDKFDRVY